MTTHLRMSRVAAPVQVLGPGARVAVWVQGCTIGCPGCASVDTWAADGGTVAEVDALAGEIVALAGDTGCSGLTITGGEPFQQAEAVAKLVSEVRSRWAGVDVLVFTGYAAAAARRRSSALWDAVDIVVAGPYRRDRPADHALLASANQTLEVLTPLGRDRLDDHPAPQRTLQVEAVDDALSLVGLPDPGDLDRLRAALEERGIHLSDVSWDAPAGVAP